MHLLWQSKYALVLQVRCQDDIETKWKWGLVKDDIKPADIFRLQKGSSSDRKLVATYCIQDCVLCNKLMEISVKCYSPFII